MMMNMEGDDSNHDQVWVHCFVDDKHSKFEQLMILIVEY